MADNTGPAGELPEFKIGLAMAGAISAGAYTAGVMDFFLQALQEWETGGLRSLASSIDDDIPASERDTYADKPAHRVTIASVAGASAGGITSAITAAVTGGPVAPVTDVPPPGGTSNPFYRSWVEKIDMRDFLQLDDIAANDGRLPSILDSTKLDEITRETLRIEGPHPHRPYIADPLRVFLTVANLRGVPYEIGQQGGGHHMTSHADYMEFAVTEHPERCPRSAIRLDPNNYEDEDWQTLGQSALASGAFPIGLAPRTLRRRAGEYGARSWQVPTETGLDHKSIAPAWKFADDDEYEFLTVDGGLMNNEPLELARRALRREGQSRNPRDSIGADRAVLMIDPFPGAPFDPDVRHDEALGTVVKAMFGALKSQARFKLDELLLAQDANVSSRFMIAPSRYDENGVAAVHAMSSAALGGFGGFLSQKFREHDFNLGRRNCQRFLMRHFLLHRDNELFRNWPAGLKDALSRPHPDKTGDTGDTGDYLPIVPLVGSALTENQPLAWPKMTESELETLRSRIRVRAGGALNAVLRPRILCGFAMIAATALKGYAAKKAVEAIREDLEKRGQLS